ncbi:MAG: hypothetical protein HQK84_07820 [Nitrospinae bacterium]|nr:hypothetical protein [Nitrospinota bacterium]
MNERISEIIEKIKNLEIELDVEFEKEFTEAREKFNYQIRRNKVLFERNALIAQRRVKKNLYRFIKDAKVAHILSAPVIYSIIIPIFLLDLFVTIYQTICFPIYKIKKVKRSEYVVIDRHMLAYLNLIEKFNCLYCGYGNGVIAYAREIASKTEEFWCPIKHAQKVRGRHSRYKDFADYGDSEGFKNKMKDVRS